MNILERVKRICVTPDTEWPVIASERTTMPALITGYVLPLAGISTLGGLIGSVLAGFSVGAALQIALMGLVLSVAGVVVLASIIVATATTFGADKNREGAARVAAYAFTPAWVAGVLRIIPNFGGLVALLGALYSLYVLYLGLRIVMKAPEDRVVAYTAVVIAVGIVIGFVTTYISASLGVGLAAPPTS